MLTNEAYIENGGRHCPECGKPELIADTPELHETNVFVNVRCDACGLQFTEIYNLVGYEVGEYDN